ncbi:MAG: hypothetical protein ACHQD8_00050 [Chitinophagales bacterium]
MTIIRTVLILLFPILLCLPAYGRNKPQKRMLSSIDTTTILRDVFKGVITDNGNEVNTMLQLDHKQYHDEGKFVYSKTYNGITVTINGEWTVLKGDAKDENATVVELDDNSSFRDYYLRRKDGNLQQLDTALLEIKPALNHILKKQ